MICFLIAPVFTVTLFYGSNEYWKLITWFYSDFFSQAHIPYVVPYVTSAEGPVLAVGVSPDHNSQSNTSVWSLR